MTSGSRLAAWAREVGELDWAVDELARADQEEDPKEVPPYDIATLIQDYEWRAVWTFARSSGISLESVINASAIGPGTGIAQQGNDAEKCDTSSTRTENQPNASPKPRTCMNTLLASMTDGSTDLPGPWPLVPFSMEIPDLQKRIPVHLLPRKLVVHDPWDLLAFKNHGIKVMKDSEMAKKWADNDVVRVYRLKLSEAGEKRIKEEKEAITKGAEASRPSTSKEECITVSDNDTAYMVILPERPPLPESTPEAHLYLSPTCFAGHGNHSIVFRAELELPRSLLTGELMCEVCVAAKASEMIAEIKKNPSHANIHERPLRIYPDVKWQNPEREPLCSHLRRTKHVPLATKVGVVAKLSIPEDNHLQREGLNYQSFPAHFFEHWTGYNLIRPITRPVPLGAVVPQFYGYYVPEKPEERRSGDDSDVDCEGYLSPILLVEDCGTPVDTTKLDETEKTDCVSLVYRFHEENWIHASLYERNIVMQPGPLTQRPASRHVSKINVFRLIDFGRSWRGESYTVTESDRDYEHRRAAELFDLPK